MSMVRNILVPTDFSETSNGALGYALGLARAFGAQLYLLHVPGGTGENFEANFPVGRFEGAPREWMSGFLNPGEIARLAPEYAVRIGVPAEEIVRYADARNIDLIVMGTHGRTGVAHLLMGSVAERVVRTAPCPVLTVRHPEHEFVKPDTLVAVTGAGA
jgi:nucleotide-binding universal stress UspA family protein